MDTELKSKIAKTKALIEGGEKVYKACRETGLSLDHWYKYASGGMELAKKRKLRKLVARHAVLSKQLNDVSRQMAELTK